MSRNRRFTSAVQELLRTVGGIEDAHRRHTDCGPTAVMVPRHPRGIGGLVKFPEGLETRMYTLRASEHVLTRQRLCLLADGVTGRDALEAAEDAAALHLLMLRQIEHAHRR